MDEYFDFDRVVGNDVAVQTNSSAPATFDTLADGISSLQATDALGRVPDALDASFEAPALIPGLTFENPWNPISGHPWDGFAGFTVTFPGTALG